MLTPADIANPKRKSGFAYVSIGGCGAGFQGSLNGGGRRDGWRGPLRRNAIEAAQDYCDYINSGQAPKGRMLKRANHPVRRSPVSKPRKTAPQVRDSRPTRHRGVMRGSVYLIGIKGDEDHVKVGFSKDAGFPRLNELQTGNPNLLVGIAEFNGTLRDEYDLHVRYEPDNVLNEWFTVSDELLSEFDLTRSEFEAAVA